MLNHLVRLALRLFLIKRPAADWPCPSCRHPVPPPPPSQVPFHGLDGIIACPNCDHRVSVLTWLNDASNFSKNPRHRSGADKSAPPQSPSPATKPPGSRITRHEAPDGSVVWNIPRTGKSGGLLFFAIAWNAISWPLTIGFLISGGFLDAPWALVLVLIFPAIGAGLLYAALRAKCATHLLGVSAARIMLERKLFGRAKRFALPTESIESVQMKEFYQQNYDPVYGIEIRGPKGKIRFGSALTDDEKEWLCQDIRAVLALPENEAVIGLSKAEEQSAAREQKRQAKRKLHVEQIGRTLIIKTPARRFDIAFLIIGLIFLGATVFLFYQGFAAIGRLVSHDDLDLFIIVFESLFAIVPILMGLVFGAVSLFLIGVGVFNRAAATELITTSGSVDWIHKSGNRETDKRHLNRNKILDIRVVRCPYESNHLPSYRGEIVGPDFVLPFGFYHPPEDLHTAAASLRTLLNLPVPTPP